MSSTFSTLSLRAGSFHHAEKVRDHVTFAKDVFEKTVVITVVLALCTSATVRFLAREVVVIALVVASSERPCCSSDGRFGLH